MNLYWPGRGAGFFHTLRHVIGINIPMSSKSPIVPFFQKKFCFGGQNNVYKLGLNLPENVKNDIDFFLLPSIHSITFQVVINNVKVHILRSLQPLNSDHSFVMLFMKK
jgi:hypothetical protein